MIVAWLFGGPCDGDAQEMPEGTATLKVLDDDCPYKEHTYHVYSKNTLCGQSNVICKYQKEV